MLLSIVLPTYNEKENIPLIVAKIEKAMKKVSYEIIVVDDDSPDGTYKVARALSQKKSHVHAIRRVRDRGLSQAVIEGFRSARGKYFAVIDADMQHDEKVLPGFLKEFEQGAELVIGSRKVEGGGIEEWSLIRRFVSWGATMLAKIALPRTVSDPMSGFFAIKRELFEEIQGEINPHGFKILLEILAQCRGRNIVEVGYVFRPRIHGESKLSGRVMLQYLVALYDIRFGRVVPVRFIKYGMVGASGVIVNFGTLWSGRNILEWKDEYALALAIEMAIISNFLFNNFWTFRDRKLLGRALARGFLKFNTICLTGFLINLSIGLLLKEKWMINIYLGDAAGILVATAWNYMINTQITWKAPQ